MGSKMAYKIRKILRIFCKVLYFWYKFQIMVRESFFNETMDLRHEPKASAVSCFVKKPFYSKIQHDKKQAA